MVEEFAAKNTSDPRELSFHGGAFVAKVGWPPQSRLGKSSNPSPPVSLQVPTKAIYYFFPLIFVPGKCKPWSCPTADYKVNFWLAPVV